MRRFTKEYILGTSHFLVHFVVKVLPIERTHTGVKPYSCVMCNNSFRQVNTLRRHELMHSGNKPFSCSTCSKTFADKRGKDTHELIHAEIKPYCCIYCKKYFRRMDDMNRHSKRVHKVKEENNSDDIHGM